MKRKCFIWQSLFAFLQEGGLEVYLCSGKLTKNIKDRKTDVQDCQWIQKLHSLGLLTSSFLPDLATQATAHKLAVIIWNMIVEHVPYNPPSQYLFMDQKRKMKLVQRIRKKIAKLELKPQDVGYSMG
jgi:hypothetical protein